jgi:hypothetical protein
MKTIKLLSARIGVLEKELLRLKSIDSLSYAEYCFLENDQYNINLEILELQKAIKILNKYL